ncbi:MAG: putative HisA/HisF family protein [Proteobacteria bacterium]|nr:putative HisA/HisF family protein [Pseudomonadota bacterium]
MEIIPVIDLMRGQVVHARHGHRETYRPIDTPLCRSSDPFAVIDAFLALHPFSSLYIADLDALTGNVPQSGLIAALAVAHPNLHIWVDSGWPTTEGTWTAVVGTESIDRAAWLRLADKRQDWILSVDFFGGSLKGPPEILDEVESWPDRIIVMTLARVGSFAGPDWSQLQSIRQLAAERKIIAAGGVRDRADVERLEAMGIAGALVASALHEGRLF